MNEIFRSFAEGINLPVEERIFSLISRNIRVRALLRQDESRVGIIGTNRDLILAKLFKETYPQTGVVVFDRNPEMETLATAAGFPFVCGEVGKDDFLETPPMEVIVARSYIHKLSYKKEALDGMAELLSPHGSLFVTVPRIAKSLVEPSINDFSFKGWNHLDIDIGPLNQTTVWQLTRRI